MYCLGQMRVGDMEWDIKMLCLEESNVNKVEFQKLFMPFSSKSHITRISWFLNTLSAFISTISWLANTSIS